MSARVCVLVMSPKPQPRLPDDVRELQRLGAQVDLVVAADTTSGALADLASYTSLDLGEPLPRPIRALRRIVRAGNPAARRGWHAIKANAPVRALIDAADVVVAWDAPAIRAAWCATRAGETDRRRSVVLGMGGATAQLSEPTP